MGRKANVLSEVERRYKRQKLRGEIVSRIIQMDVKVEGDDKFMRCDCSDGKE